MDLRKHEQSINLSCPTCGETSFEIGRGVDQTIELAKCARCGREITKDELINENGEHISEILSEIKKEIIEDVTEELRKKFQRSFGNSRNLKIK